MAGMTEDDLRADMRKRFTAISSREWWEPYESMAMCEYSLVRLPEDVEQSQ